MLHFLAQAMSLSLTYIGPLSTRIHTGQLKQELEILENEFRSAIRKSR